MLNHFLTWLYRRRYRRWVELIRPLRGLQAKMTFRDYVDMVWAQRIKFEKSIYFGYGEQRQKMSGITGWLCNN